MKLSTLEQIKDIHSEGKLVGCFDIDHDLYHHKDCPGISRSKMLNARKTPQEFKYLIDNPKEQSDAMLLGLALHTLVLEPEDFPKKFVKAEMRKGSKKYDKWVIENGYEKHTVLTEKHWEDVGGMARKLKSQRKAMQLLSGHHEKAFFWIDETTGLLCKCKPDSVHLKYGVIADLKKTKDASLDGFIKEVFNHDYHIQNAFYLDGVIEAVKQGGKGDFEFKTPDVFVFVTIQADAPYVHSYQDLEPEFVEEGREEYRWLLKRYKKYMEKEPWSECYTEQIITAKSKSWMYRNRRAN